jgi:hypothetical protein
MGFKRSGRGRIEVMYRHLPKDMNKTTGSVSDMIPNGHIPKKSHSVTNTQNKLVTADIMSQNSGLLRCDIALLC